MKNTDTKINGKISKLPLSQFMNPKRKPQLGVSVSLVKGQTIVDVYISDYNGARKKLNDNKELIVAAIVEGLSKAK